MGVPGVRIHFVHDAVSIWKASLEFSAARCDENVTTDSTHHIIGYTARKNALEDRAILRSEDQQLRFHAANDPPNRLDWARLVKNNTNVRTVDTGDIQPPQQSCLGPLLPRRQATPGSTRIEKKERASREVETMDDRHFDRTQELQRGGNTNHFNERIR